MAPEHRSDLLSILTLVKLDVQKILNEDLRRRDVPIRAGRRRELEAKRLGCTAIRFVFLPPEPANVLRGKRTLWKG